MQVFKDLINHGLDAVMPAHVVYSQVDSSPAGFSSKWIKEIGLFLPHLIGEVQNLASNNKFVFITWGCTWHHVSLFVEVSKEI
jgi:hypothetical protein